VQPPEEKQLPFSASARAIVFLDSWKWLISGVTLGSVKG